jgi:hypothetical protein
MSPAPSQEFAPRRAAIGGEYIFRRPLRRRLARCLSNLLGSADYSKEVVMRLLTGVVFFALLLSLPVHAAEDLSGTWAGAFIITLDGETQPDVVHMVLKHEGAVITGTAGPSIEQQWKIIDGKVEGDKVTFRVEAEIGFVQFAMELVEGHLKGQATASVDGQAFTAAIDVERKK